MVLMGEEACKCSARFSYILIFADECGRVDCEDEYRGIKQNICKKDLKNT